MGQTKKNYLIWDCALLVQGYQDHGNHERANGGDIITIRPERDDIGMKEMRMYLWLRLYGLDDHEMYALKHQIEHPTNKRIFYDKRRYCIPFTRLQQQDPSLNLARVLDPQDPYQFYHGLDEDNGILTKGKRPAMHVSGLVYDKQLGRYL